MRAAENRGRGRYRVGLLLGLFAATWPLGALAQERVSSEGAANAVPRINRTGRALPLNAPLTHGGAEIGTLDLTVAPDDTVEVSTLSLLAALEDDLRADKLRQLSDAFATRESVPLDELHAHGLVLTFRPDTLTVELDLPGEAAAVRNLSLRPQSSIRGEFTQPADLSAYVNIRSALDYVWDGEASDPVFGFDGALRAFGVVLEGEGGYRSTTGDTSEFVRDGTRLVYDHRGLLARFTAGDLLTEARGFQSAPLMAGVSVVRSYREIDPTRNVYPRGAQSFTLQRPSTVDVVLNGQRVDTLRLGPGAYNLQDFPFYSGANDVRLLIQDDVGRREELQFDVFFDRQLLQAGAREFGAYAGIAAFPSFEGREYDADRPLLTGFYRAGINDNLTLGANLQGDEQVQQVGVEAVFGTKWGLVGIDLAVSNVDALGSGVAVNAIVQSGAGASTARQRFFLGVNYRSEQFASVGELIPSNPFNYEVFGGYSRAIGENTFFNATLSHSAGRTGGDVSSARAGFSRNFNRTWVASVEAVHQVRLDEEESGIRLSISRRFGSNTTANAIYDSSTERASVDFYTGGGDGVGAWYASADVQTDEIETAANASMQYNANRAQITVDHHTPIDSQSSGELQQRTSLRVASSVAFADGVFGIGRPIYDAFAVAAPHRSLDGADVDLDIHDVYYEGRSGLLGAAVAPNIASYTERSIIYNVPEAPPGYDLGEGSLRAFAPYRAGYSVVVGSDYSITAMGRLIDQDGRVVTLLAGRAVELGASHGEPLVVFTNRDGRFIIAGVRPGRWQIRMPTQPPTVVEIEVPEDSSNLLQLGDVRLREDR